LGVVSAFAVFAMTLGAIVAGAVITFAASVSGLPIF
jgi:hypothetical protein